MLKAPVVMVDVMQLGENRFRCDGEVWSISHLLTQTKALKPFWIPLAGIYLGANMFDSIKSAKDLAFHITRVQNTELKYPIVLDGDGFIMDGWHRVVKALVLGRRRILAVRFDHTPAPTFIEPKDS